MNADVLAVVAQVVSLAGVVWYVRSQLEAVKEEAREDAMQRSEGIYAKLVDHKVLEANLQNTIIRLAEIQSSQLRLEVKLDAVLENTRPPGPG